MLEGYFLTEEDYIHYLTYIIYNLNLTDIEANILTTILNYYYKDFFIAHPPIGYEEDGLLTLNFNSFKQLCGFSSDILFIKCLHLLENKKLISLFINQNKQYLQIFLNIEEICHQNK